ncbi:MAG: choline dehydrogenase [Betaproteobacteria bacterium RIFCSPLOWO2_12_FULL_63_13]|nr:MAG: choline dehydrogenase [Betaproteobacteria bacterium RIFCSPLOWO2_02_FULL_63_19]OGA47631.1 MAG: choline dehydrogenase [Betaproteobacteria bacterium RIFCSPLOWO2_12_FULL_63_13]
MERYEADIVVVGAGSAGCVLAARLSEDPHLRVLLLEAGGPDSNIWIHVPGGISRTVGNPRLDWCIKTEPIPGCNGRRMPYPRGKVLGGSGSLNGMQYIRGNPRDYERWRELGNEGWGWSNVLPYFRRSEANVHGADELHGDSGPLAVSDMLRGELADASLRAAVEAGYPLIADFNGPSQEGAAYYQMMIRRGRRGCGAGAYLRPAMRRANLQVLTSAHATRILFDGRRALGVEFRRGGQILTARARREVVIAGGAFHSPHLLQLSGVGPAALLARYGIAVIADLPGVGANLQDHLQVRVLCRSTQPVTINDILNSPLRLAGEVAKYLFSRTGLLAYGPFRTGLFACSSASPGWPDLQVQFGPVGFSAVTEPPLKYSSFTMSVCLLRPSSRGSVEIGSSDPFAAPKIQPDFLSTENDRRLMIEAFKLGRTLLAQPSLAAYVAEEILPGSACRSDAQILEHVRETGSTVHHPVGTCRMGADQRAVVDARLRVRGTSGLRVVDGAIMPELISGNVNAPIVMIAEKASDLMREDLRAQAAVPR